GHRGHLDHGHLHVSERASGRQLRLRQRGRRDALHHHPHRRPRVPALRPAPRHRRRADRGQPKGAPAMTDTLKTSVAIQAIGPRGRRRAASGVRWGSPGVYLLAVILITICITPLLYIIVGGFRTNAQITNDPSGWPAPWEIGNYTDV